MKAKKYIYEGDIYQVNLSQKFFGKTISSPFSVYEKLRKKNPAPYSAFMQIDKNHHILSTSPELFLKLNSNKIETHPIKGTIQRSKIFSENETLKQKLFNSEKDFAELLMIVDMERNDLNRICKTGSVNVETLKQIETYETVHHLVAKINGKLQNKINVFETIKSMFPGGSITGAPKIRAMEIIDELEKSHRGIYTGSIGFIDFSLNAMFNIAIRTLMMENEKFWFNVGSGIVADSSPEKEYQETLHKAKGILSALNIEI